MASAEIALVCGLKVWVGYHNRQRLSRGHKARGQGQGHKKNPRPRTGMLEAKDTNASVFLRKKVLKFFFRSIPPKKWPRNTFFGRSTKF